MSTYGLENSSSTIAGNPCYANVAMWECYCHCHCISPLLLSQLLPLPVNPTVFVVTPVTANTAFHLNCLSHCHLYWC